MEVRKQINSRLILILEIWMNNYVDQKQKLRFFQIFFSKYNVFEPVKVQRCIRSLQKKTLVEDKQPYLFILTNRTFEEERGVLANIVNISKNFKIKTKTDENENKIVVICPNDFRFRIINLTMSFSVLKIGILSN